MIERTTYLQREISLRILVNANSYHGFQTRPTPSLLVVFYPGITLHIFTKKPSAATLALELASL